MQNSTIFSVLFHHLFMNLVHEQPTPATTTIKTPIIRKALSLEKVPEMIGGELDCRGAIGCFPLGFPWESSERPVALRPDAIEDIQPQFCLHSNSKSQNQIINFTENSISGNLNIFDNSHIVLLTHGFGGSVDRTWVKIVKEQLIENYESRLRVITLDWRTGARPPYAQTVANTRVVGALAGRVLQLLIEKYNVLPMNIHLVGHSLGAQMMGYTGDYLKIRRLLVGRITGLDPAGPYFNGTPEKVRLDKSDSYFVDVIHTDANPVTFPSLTGSLGSSELSGNFDFFPNGGMDQSNCRKTPQGHMLSNVDETEGFLEFFICSHETAHRYFTSSLHNKCTYIGVECSSWEDFKAGKCFDCKVHRCFQMGMNINRIFPKKFSGEKKEIQEILETENKIMKLYLATAKKESLCGEQLRFTLVTSASEEAINSGGEFVKFSLIIRGSKGVAETSPYKNSRYLKPGSEVTWVDAIPDDLGEILSIMFSYPEEEGFLKSLFRMLIPNIFLKEVKVEKLLDSKEKIFKFCEEKVMSGETRLLKPDVTCEIQPTTSIPEQESIFDFLNK